MYISRTAKPHQHVNLYTTAPSPRILSTPEELGAFQRTHPVAFLLALPADGDKGKKGGPKVRFTDIGCVHE